MPLQLSKVVERIGAGEFAGMDQTHEQIASFGAVQSSIKQGILRYSTARLSVRSHRLLSNGHRLPAETSDLSSGAANN
jgi:hypothetical protein